MRITCCAALALMIHIALGWGWTVAAGVVAGYWRGSRGWLDGALAVGLSWGLIVAFSFAVAPVETTRMATFLASLFGGSPAPVAPLMTLLAGAVIGTAGGLLGTGARQIIEGVRR